MSELRRAWGPNAITRWSVITAALVLLATALPEGQGGIEGTGVRVLTAIGALVAGAAVLGIARATWLTPGGGGLRWARALITFAGAGAVVGATRHWLVLAADADDPLGLTWRVVAGGVAAAIWLSITAIVVDHVRRHRAAMSSLGRRRAEMEDLDRREREELDVTARRLRDELLVPARDAMRRIEMALVKVGAGAPAIEEAARIEEAVATSIRPLSHDILTADPAVDADIPDAQGGDRWTRLGGRAARQVTHAPWIVTALLVVLSPLQLGPSWGATFLIVNAVVSWPVYALLLVLMRKVLEPRLQALPAAGAGLLLALGYALVSAAAISVTWALGFLSPRDVPYFWVGILTFTGVLLAASLLEAAADLADDDERALRDVLARIAVSVTRIRQRIRHEYQVIGALLHGPVQGALLGVVASLEQAPDDLTADERRALVDQSLQRMAEAKERLEGPPARVQSIDEMLEGVMRMWTRAMDVRLQMHADARIALDASPAARAAVAGVVTEALTNALRHGGARRADVTISLQGDCACVVVVDDGRLHPGGEPGMGSRLYDECSHRWSLRAGPGGDTALRLLVPVTPGGTGGLALHAAP